MRGGAFTEGGSLTDVAGVMVGHWTHARGATGCTVVVTEAGAVAGVDIRGAAPGTRETDLLAPLRTVRRVHAVLLTGGSAFGLDAAAGVVRWLEERGSGYDVGVGVVPIVPAAVVFDLPLGDPQVRPGPDEGYAACAAATNGRVPEGCVGAGCGCSVGNVLGLEGAMKTGIGSAALMVPRGDGCVVAAVAVVNAFGDVVDPDTGTIIAGARQDNAFVDTEARILAAGLPRRARDASNTTLVVVATDAIVEPDGAAKAAQIAHNGLARTVRPVHTAVDGDAVFVLATGRSGERLDATELGVASSLVAARAVVRGATQATSMAGLPAARDL